MFKKKKKKTRKLRKWVIWIHLLHIFPAGLLLLLRLTYLNSHCSHQDCAASYVPAVLASYTLLVYSPGCLEGPDQGQSFAAADCELAYEQREAVSASVRVPARYNRQRHRDMRGLYRMSCSIFITERRTASCGVPALCPPSWTVLPLSLFFFSYLFLSSFILDSTTHNSLPSLGCFSPSSPKPS